MKYLIIYDCDPDGLGAAVAVAWNLPCPADEPTFRKAIRYEGPDLEGVTKDTEVFIVDFCFKGKFMGPLCEAAGLIHVIDHHGESVDKDLDGFTADNLNIENNTNFSACVLAWQYMVGENQDDAPCPKVLEYIQDADLWTWKLEDSKTINAAIDCLSPTIDEYINLLIGSNDKIIDQLRTDGHAIEAYKNKTMDIMENYAVMMDIAGYKVPAVNCSDPSIVSYLGNRLAVNQPFAVTYYLQSNLKWKFSIRSITGKDLPGINVREIAQIFGGGGHPNASGFKVDKLFEMKKAIDNEVSR